MCRAKRIRKNNVYVIYPQGGEKYVFWIQIKCREKHTMY